MSQPKEVSISTTEPSWARWIFCGEDGLRSGWRVLVFMLLLVILVVGSVRLVRALGIHQPRGAEAPSVSLAGEVLLCVSVLIATAVMARFEHRSLGGYGLALREGFLKRLGYGAMWGVVPLAVLLLVLRGIGVLRFRGPQLPAGTLLWFSLLWAMVFVLTGIAEEAAVRGYPQFTLAGSIGFWPAAVITSLILAVAHVGNSGEAVVGLIAVFGDGLVACLMLHRTGDLWFPIGFHFAWDYAESFVFGVPDSGNVAIGHLLSAETQGSKWLTGGSVGPEGSVLVFIILGLTALAFHRAYPTARTSTREMKAAGG
jgi:membrane protease YdiL (CAAX protease family)